MAKKIAEGLILKEKTLCKAMALSLIFWIFVSWSTLFSFAEEKAQEIWVDVTDNVNRSLLRHLPRELPKNSPHQLPRDGIKVNYEKVYFAPIGCEVYFTTSNQITIRATEPGYIELMSLSDRTPNETLGFAMEFLPEKKDHKPVQLVPRGIIKEKCIPLMDKLPKIFYEKFKKLH